MHHLKIQGRLTPARLKIILKSIGIIKLKKPNIDTVIDLMDVRLDLSNDEIRQLADYIQGHCESDAPVALVSNDDLTFGLLRMLKGHVDRTSLNFHVTRSNEDAKNWFNELAA